MTEGPGCRWLLLTNHGVKGKDQPYILKGGRAFCCRDTHNFREWRKGPICTVTHSYAGVIASIPVDVIRAMQKVGGIAMVRHPKVEVLAASSFATVND